MKTLSEYFQRDSAYWGENGDWLVVATLNRDSDCLSRSNFRCLIKLLGGKGTEGGKGSQSITDNLAIEEATHWACGRLQYLVINTADLEAVKIAQAALERMDDYPVLDEDDFTNLESEEANKVWKDCYLAKERVEYVREHKSQFEFRSFEDLLGCIRGKYFAGYASELLN